MGGWVLLGWVGCASPEGNLEAVSPGQAPAPAPIEVLPTGALQAAVAQGDRGAGELSSLPDVAERVVRSVVTVLTTNAEREKQHRSIQGFGPMDEDFGRGLGSGVLVRADGIVVTNHHVIQGADQVKVTFGEGPLYEAEIVGSDPRTDIAVLRMQKPPAGLVPLEFGDSDGLRLGEVVLAVGNPFGVGQTVTMGIVSAKGRANLGLVDYEDFIQTDAAINPGNSGGALVDLRGSLVGINTAIYSPTGGSNGIGFAIPAGLARDITEMILEKGRVTRGYLGLAVRDLTPERRAELGVPDGAAVEVQEVSPESPADRAGLRAGDVILSFDGRRLDASRFQIAVASAGAAHPFQITILRGGQQLELTGILGDLPGDQLVGPGHELARELKLQLLSDELRQRYGIPDGIMGVWVLAVASQGRLASGGVLPKDLIMEVNHQPVQTPEELSRRFAEASHARVWLQIWRNGRIFVLGV